MEEGRTYEIATFFKPSPNGPSWAHNISPPEATWGAKRVIENRQMLDQSNQIALLVTLYWLPVRDMVNLINDKVGSQVAFMATTNESPYCS